MKRIETITRMTSAHEVPPSYRWELLFWLWIAFFLNQADRQVFNVILPLLQSSLGLSYVQVGLIASIFTVAVGVCVPIAGYFGDISSRKWIVVGSLILWSGATLLTGFSTGLIYLIVVRSIATAGGEAFYAPSSNALISEYHEKTRAQAFAIHQTALYTGIIASGWIAGYIGEHFGWRESFWVFGAAGIVVAAFMSHRLRPEKIVPRQDRVSPIVVLKSIMRRPTVALLGLGFGSMIFVNVGYLTWTPTYLYEHFGLSLAEAGFSSMIYHHVGAYAGVLVGSRLSDWLAQRRPVYRLQMQAAALLLGAPFIYMVGREQNLHVVYIMLGGFGFFRGVYDSNIYASLYEVIEPSLHASAAAVIIALAFCAGSVAPVVLGAVGESTSLGVGISYLSGAYVLGSLFICIAAQCFFGADRKGVTAYART